MKHRPSISICKLVDTGITGNDVGQQLGVAIDEAAHGPAQKVLRQSTHRQQACLQLVELDGNMAKILIHGPIMNPRRYIPVTNPGSDDQMPSHFGQR